MEQIGELNNPLLKQTPTEKDGTRQHPAPHTGYCSYRPEASSGTLQSWTPASSPLGGQSDTLWLLNESPSSERYTVYPLSNEGCVSEAVTPTASEKAFNSNQSSNEESARVDQDLLGNQHELVTAVPDSTKNEGSWPLKDTINTIHTLNTGLEVIQSSKRTLKTPPVYYSSSSQLPLNCMGQRKPPIGEKCFALLVLFQVFGIILSGFGATCLIPTKESEKLLFCETIGGMVTALLVACAGGVLILVGIVSCILINECSGRELHGGKCHINCHIFEDLVESA